MPKKTIAQVDVRCKRVLTRVDFNVPLSERPSPQPSPGGRGSEIVITDDNRIRQALPTIRSVIERGGRAILMSHLGRPEGKGFEPADSLKPAACRLRELLPGVNVVFPSDDCVDAGAAAAVGSLKDGEIVVLENLRFHKGEKKGDAEFAAKLAAFGDIYCNDAFGTAHRNDASMLAVPLAMKGKPRVVGLLMEKELRYLSEALNNPQRPFVAVLGGAKVSDKLGAIRHLLNKVDSILVGGAMAYTFLKAAGHMVGSSLVEDAMLGEAQAILDAAASGQSKLVLPRDHVCAKKLAVGVPTAVFPDDIPDGWLGLDIGPQTMTQYSMILRAAKTIVWNGPMGVFETHPFELGTRDVANSIAKATDKGAVSIVGGGDSAAAVEAFGLADRFTHVSTGGGASLQMLEGKPFDSLSVIDEA